MREINKRYNPLILSIILGVTLQNSQAAEIIESASKEEMNQPEKSVQITSELRDLSWNGLYFTPEGQSQFNQTILGALDIFLEKYGNYGRFKDIPLQDYSQDIVNKAQEAQNAYEAQYTQIEKQPTHPLIPFFKWLSEYAQGNVGIEHGYTQIGKIDSDYHPNITLSDLAETSLKQYSLEMQKLLTHPNPNFSAEYGFHAYVFGYWDAFSGYCDRQGSYRIYYRKYDKEYGDTKSAFDSTLNIPHICAGASTSLCHPFFKNSIKKRLVRTQDLQRNKHTYLRFSEETQDEELAKITLETTYWYRHIYESPICYKNTPILKALFTLGNYDKIVEDVQWRKKRSLSEITDKKSLEVLQEYFLERRYEIWALSALGRTKEAADKINTFEQEGNILDSGIKRNEYIGEYARCLVSAEGYTQAIPLLQELHDRGSIKEEFHAYFLWCHREIGNLKEEELLKKAFIEKYNDSVLSYHYAHFDRDKKGYALTLQ